jgi:hypothetical protein
MQVLAINKRVQTQNNAPLGFPNFVRDGYEIIILADGYQESQDGLIWKVVYQHATCCTLSAVASGLVQQGMQVCWPACVAYLAKYQQALISPLACYHLLVSQALLRRCGSL